MKPAEVTTIIACCVIYSDLSRTHLYVQSTIQQDRRQKREVEIIQFFNQNRN